MADCAAAPAPAPAPTTTAGSFSALPADVIVTILRFLPLVPRIRTIATLSKRWRELAYRSVDALTDYPLEKSSYCTPPHHKALRLLTSLTSLNLRVTRSCPREYTFPVTLRHLAIRSPSPIAMLGPRPALTSLSLRSYGRYSREAPSQLIEQFAPSLRRLDLFSSDKTLRFTALMATLHLPQLTDLAVGPEFDTHLRDFYRRHASKLQALTIRFPFASNRRRFDTSPRVALDAVVCKAPLPLLRTLTLSVPMRSEPTLATLQQILLKCPALTALHTDFPPRCGASVLRTITLPATGLTLTLNDAQTIAECTRLEAISAMDFQNQHMALANHYHLITHCQSNATPAELLALPRMTRLRSLVLQYPPAELPPLASLASLRELKIICRSLDQSRLDHFLQYCPGLSSVTISGHSLDPTRVIPLARELDRRGVAELTVKSLAEHEIQRPRGRRLEQPDAPRDLHWLQLHKLANTPKQL